jgi:hypothetical protein
MSSKKTPVLSHAVPAFKELIKWWEKIVTLIPHCMPLINVGLTWADKYNEQMGTVMHGI